MNAPQARLSTTEFTILMAMNFALVAAAIDTMLPAMGLIAVELSPDAPNRAQLVITCFVAGMGIGTMFTGPLSDAIGRRAVIFGGVVIFAIGSVLSWVAPTIELMVAARFLQGLGVSGPRIAGMAVTRDLYAGREMARIMSLTMMIFVLVPAIAPMFGAWITQLVGWRAIFPSLVVFSTTIVLWYMLRQPETLDQEKRIKLSFANFADGLRQVLSNRSVVLATLALTLAFSVIFIMISTIHQVFEHAFDRGGSFPYWFALMSVLSASAGFFNARVVGRLGMRRVVILALSTQAVLSGAMLVVVLNADVVPPNTYFGVYFLWVLSAFMCAGGFSIGNLNALALEPLGHIAGMASSVISSLATLASAILVGIAGSFLDGTPLVQVLTVGGCALGGVLLIGLVRD